MNIYHFLDTRLPVTIGSRRFSVRRIRLQDVLNLLVRFDGEIRSFMAMEKPEALKLLSALGPDETADLFGYFVEPHDPIYLRENLDFAKRAELLVLIQAVNDVGRIWRSLKLAKPRGTEAPAEKIEPLDVPSAVPSMLRVIDALARRYRVSPFSIPEWPYEGFLDLLELVEDERKAQRNAELEEGIPLPDGSFLDYDALDDSRIEAKTIPDLNKLVN